MKAIGKLLRTLGYLFTFRINKIADVWSKQPGVISARYDAVVEGKKARITEYKEAVGGLMVSEEKKKAKLAELTKEVSRLEVLRQGALLKAKEAQPNSSDYEKCKAAYRDFSSSLEEKNKRIAELEEEVKGISSGIAKHKTQIDSLLRELEKIRDEKHETIAEVAAAQEKQKIADLFSGISEDKTDNELRELREIRTKAHADARISTELAGMDTKSAEEEFLKYATQNVADDEFDRLLGVSKEVPAANVVSETKISEE